MRVRRVLLCSVSLGAVLGCAHRVAHAEVVGCRSDDVDRRRLMVINDPKTLKPKHLRTFDGRIVESEPSPHGRFVGVLVVDPKSNHEGLWTFTFHAIDQRGRTVATVPKAQGFSFSPNDDYVAVTTGRPLEGASGFVPEATQVVDLKAKKQWSVPEFKDATEVDWTNLPDEGLTLMAKKPLGRQKVWKYRLKNRRAIGTKWKGIHFSPDGKYYYMTPREAIDAGMCKPGDKNDSCIRAYSSRNKEVKLRLRKRVRRLLGWTGRTGHELMVRDGFGREEERMEIDLATGRMRVLKERLNRKWKLRRGARLLEEKKGKLRIRMNKLFDEINERTRRRRRQRDY